MWRLLIIAFGNIRDIVLANAGSTSAGKTLKTKFYKGVTPLDDTQRAADNYVTDTMEAMFNTYYNKKIPDCLGQITMAQNSKDPDASQYAEMIVDIMSKVHSELSRNAITITNATAGVVMPHKVAYNEMRAVSNGNASFGLAAKEIPSGTTLVETQLPLSETFQPNVVVLDPKVQYPWESSILKLSQSLQAKSTARLRLFLEAHSRHHSDLILYQRNNIYRLATMRCRLLGHGLLSPVR